MRCKSDSIGGKSDDGARKSELNGKEEKRKKRRTKEGNVFLLLNVSMVLAHVLCHHLALDVWWLAKRRTIYSCIQMTAVD